MDEIKRLMQERKDALAAAKALKDAAAEEDRELTAEEFEQIEKHAARAAELRDEIAAAEEAYQKQMAVLASLEAENAWEHETQEPIVAVSPTAKPKSQPKIVGGEGAKEFRSFGEYLHNVQQAATDPKAGGDLTRKIQASISGLSTAVDSDGGFLIPDEFSNRILKIAHEGGEVLSRVQKITLSGNTLKIPRVDESSREAGSRWGGVRGYWTAEGGTPTASDPKFGQVELNLKKVACVGYVTDEQLEDYAATGSILEQAFAEEMRFKVEEAIMVGDGSGKPLGMTNANCKIEVSAETNQTADTVWGPNIVKMWARLWARCRKNAVWYISQDVEPYLWGLTLEGRWGSASTDVDGVPLYYPAGSITNQGEYGLLMGRPVVPIEYCPVVGDAGDVILCDPSQYLFASKGGVKADRSMHVRFLYNEQTFRTTYRVDGQPWWGAALTPFNGGDTVSPIITLAARA